MRDHRKLCCAHTRRGDDTIWVHTCIHDLGHGSELPHHCTCTYEWDTQQPAQISA